LGGGLVLQAPIARRPHDSMGMGVTEVDFSKDPNASFDEDSEVVFEFYYKFKLTGPFVTIPDFQYLHHPGGISADKDSPVISQRLVVSF